MMTRRTVLQTAAIMAPPLPALGQTAPEVLVRSPRFIVNGAATGGGRIYLSLPSWTGMAGTPGLAVASDAGPVPFPGGDWHDPASPPEDRLVQINAVRVSDGLIWVVDQAGKLLAFDPDSALVYRLAFDRTVLPEGAAMNDLRKRGPHIYITDSGLGGLILHDLETGRTLRRLSENPALRMEPDRVQRGTGGRALQDAQGKRPQVHADMIEISPDGQWLYWAFPAGPLRRIRTAALWAGGDAPIETAAEIPSIGGAAMDDLGNIYLADAEARRIAVLTPDGAMLTLVQDDRLISPDALWIDADRRLLIPASQAENLPEHANGEDRLQQPFLVLAMPLPETLEGVPLGRAMP